MKRRAAAQKLRSRARGIRWRAHRLAHRCADQLPGRRADREPFVGMVETFESKQIVGWVSGPANRMPVRVRLCVNDDEVASTWADHPSRHNTWGRVRGFRFPLADLWKFCKTTDQVTVRVGNVPLPIAGKGVYRRPGVDGTRSLSDLRRMLAGKYVFNQNGQLRVSKRYDTEWQNAVLNLYGRVGEFLRREFGYDLFAIYGTLLGLVRDGGFIGHDVDFDVAYISKQTEPGAVADELRDIAFALIDAGFDVVCMTTAVHVHDERDPRIRIDLFHLFFNEHGVLTFPFGKASDKEITETQWAGLTDARLAGRAVRVPAIGEAMAECLYGPTWRIPIPGFQWARARKGWGAGDLPESYCEEVHWANFYAHHRLTEPSPFFGLVAGRDDVPHTVLDLGCGDGRDSLAFAQLGWRVLGLDRSRLGIRNATERAAEAGLATAASFLVADVADAAAVRAAVKQARDAADGDGLLFYLRFLLNSLTEDAEQTLLATLAEAAQPGDFLAAEFRTVQDEETTKTHRRHYRRYLDGAAFAESLRDRFGFDVVHEEAGQGLSPYHDEDPVLYRVIATATARDTAG